MNGPALLGPVGPGAERRSSRVTTLLLALGALFLAPAPPAVVAMQVAVALFGLLAAWESTRLSTAG
ncbi:MAG: hypothetical protein R2854_15255 [Caldilineaceae bacterium]